MKIVALVARILLGLIFVVFGLNGFLQFLPMPPISGLAGQFIGALFASHYLTFVFAVQLVGGVLLLTNRYVPFALTVLGPVIVNILLFHIFLSPAGFANALVATILWFMVFAEERHAFSRLFEPRTTA